MHDEVVPVAAHQLGEADGLAAGAGRLIDEADLDELVAAPEVKRRGPGLGTAVGVVPFDDRSAGRTRRRCPELIPLRVAAHIVLGPHHLPAVPALIALVLPHLQGRGEDAALVGVRLVCISVLHLEADRVVPLEHGVVDHLDLLRTDRLLVAPSVVSVAAVAGERRGASLEIPLPDHVRIVRIRGRGGLRCARDEGDSGETQGELLHETSPWLVACRNGEPSPFRSPNPGDDRHLPWPLYGYGASSERSSVLRGLSPLAVLRPRTSRIAGVRQIAAPTAPSDPEHGSSTGVLAHGAPAEMGPTWRFVRRSTSADPRTRSGLVEPRSHVCQGRIAGGSVFLSRGRGSRESPSCRRGSPPSAG